MSVREMLREGLEITAIMVWVFCFVGAVAAAVIVADGRWQISETLHEWSQPPVEEGHGAPSLPE